MSLVVARQSEGEITIVSETKLTYPDHAAKRQQTNPEEGTLKTTLINDRITVSFAGDMDAAEHALQQIKPDDSVADIITLLKNAHQDAAYKTEFIVCYLDPKPTIYKIKNNEFGEVVSTWIGDITAFNVFQSFMTGNPETAKHKKKDRRSGSQSRQPSIQFDEVNLAVSGPSSKLASAMCTAMDKLVLQGAVQSVGGFRVHVKMKEKSAYNFYLHTYRPPFEVVVNGPGIIPLGHGTAEEGAYTVYFLGGSSDHQHVGIHIRQGNFGIIYSRDDGGIFKPVLYKLDEVDFLEVADQTFGIKGPFSTMDRVAKFAKDGLAAFNSSEYARALIAFDKALETAKGKHQAELLFYKGVTYLNLRDPDAARKMFADALQINPELQARIQAVFQQRPF